jgi:hypothetical protein
MFGSLNLAAVLLLAVPLVSAHGLISSVTGDLGGKGSGFGVAANGINYLGDVTVFRGNTGAFGATGLRVFSLQSIHHE